MIKALKIETTCVSAVSLIFFETMFQNFQRKMLSTFSTLSTKLIFNKIIYIFKSLQTSTIFYKMPLSARFSTFFYDFYTLIAGFVLQIADYKHCRKNLSCRKCRRVKCVCPTNINALKQVARNRTNLNTFAR